MIKGVVRGDRIKVLARILSVSTDDHTWDIKDCNTGTVTRVYRKGSFVLIHVCPDHINHPFSFPFLPRDLERL